MIFSCIIPCTYLARRSRSIACGRPLRSQRRRHHFGLSPSHHLRREIRPLASVELGHLQSWDLQVDLSA
jgi:hypothetical protein